MLKLYEEGVRILFFCGGETLLWEDKGKTAKDLIREAKENHNYIRGNTFDTILQNVEEANESNICVYMAINNRNYKDIKKLCELVKNTKNLKSISFNFHTPYKGTENLSLSKEQKFEIVNTIKQLMKEGYPIFNLYETLKTYLKFV